MGASRALILLCLTFSFVIFCKSSVVWTFLKSGVFCIIKSFHLTIPKSARTCVQTNESLCDLGRSVSGQHWFERVGLSPSAIEVEKLNHLPWRASVADDESKLSLKKKRNIFRLAA